MIPKYYCYYSNESNAVDVPVVYGLNLLGYDVYHTASEYVDPYRVCFFVEAKDSAPDLLSVNLDKEIKEKFPNICISKYLKDFNLKKVKLFEFTINKVHPLNFYNFMENLNEQLVS